MGPELRAGREKLPNAAAPHGGRPPTFAALLLVSYDRMISAIVWPFVYTGGRAKHPWCAAAWRGRLASHATQAAIAPEEHSEERAACLVYSSSSHRPSGGCHRIGGAHCPQRAEDYPIGRSALRSTEPMPTVDLCSAFYCMSPIWRAAKGALLDGRLSAPRRLRAFYASGFRHQAQRRPLDQARGNRRQRRL